VFKNKIIEGGGGGENRTGMFCAWVSMNFRKVTRLVLKEMMGQVIWSETAIVVLAGWSNIYVQLLNLMLMFGQLKYKQQGN